MKTQQQLLNEFRGLPLDYIDPPMRKAKTLDTLIEAITEKYQISPLRIEEQIIRNWKLIVGEARAHRCSPVRIDEGTLIITTTNPTLRSELLFDQSGILKRLQQSCGDETVRAVRIR